MIPISDALISLERWDHLEQIDGPATDVGVSLEKLLAAKSAEEAETAYWQLENRVVAQGSVYNACVPVARILIASLLDNRPFPVRVAILQLLYQILVGVSVYNDDLIDKCRRIVAEGTWLIVREFLYGPRDPALDVLQCLQNPFDFETLRSHVVSSYGRPAK